MGRLEGLEKFGSRPQEWLAALLLTPRFALRRRALPAAFVEVPLRAFAPGLEGSLLGFRAPVCAACLKLAVARNRALPKAKMEVPS